VIGSWGGEGGVVVWGVGCGLGGEHEKELWGWGEGGEGEEGREGGWGGRGAEVCCVRGVGGGVVLGGGGGLWWGFWGGGGFCCCWCCVVGYFLFFLSAPSSILDSRFPSLPLTRSSVHRKSLKQRGCWGNKTGREKIRRKEKWTRKEGK